MQVLPVNWFTESLDGATYLDMLQPVVWLAVRGFLVIGQFAVRKNVSFDNVRLGQIRLG